MAKTDAGSAVASLPPAAHGPARTRRWVYFLEECFRVPGTSWRFGWEPVVGMLLPGVGDALSAVAGLPLLIEGVRRRLPLKVLLVMLVNTLLGAVVGVVPVLGDAFDFAWKPQRKNLRLLEEPAAVAAIAREAKIKVGLLAAAVAALLALLVFDLIVVAYVLIRLLDHWLGPAG